jgi:hypothetical protein
MKEIVAISNRNEGETKILAQVKHPAEFFINLLSLYWEIC